MVQIIANRLEIPQKTSAILWDMDGVLIDSLGLDLIVCNDLLQAKFGSQVELSREFIKSLFAYDVPTFWKFILEKIETDFYLPKDKTAPSYEELLNLYYQKRQNYPFETLPGIKEILAATLKPNIKIAVVSNNPRAEIEKILKNSGLGQIPFSAIIGTDEKINDQNINPKPAPDMYLAGIAKLAVEAKNCVVIEDSVLGVQAGRRAGCYVVGVGTGGGTIRELEDAGADVVYEDFNSKE